MMASLRWMLAAALLLTISGCTTATPVTGQQQVLVDEARIAFDRLVTHPNFGELPDFVRRSKAIMIFPSLVKGGVIVGGEGGSGVILVRDAQRGWSDPAFYTLAAGSLGLQLGGQVSEVVLAVMNDKAVNALIDNQMKFGGDMSVAAGPSGKRSGTSATTSFGSDVYAFALTEGLFGGVSFEGAAVLKRDSWNKAYYGEGATPYGILVQRQFTNPNARALINALSPY
ncbi:MAG: lipid-binding SYLF domain-containing protein [Dongiaceae bacterium]